MSGPYSVGEPRTHAEGDGRDVAAQAESIAQTEAMDILNSGRFLDFQFLTPTNMGKRPQIPSLLEPALMGPDRRSMSEIVMGGFLMEPV